MTKQNAFFIKITSLFEFCISIIPHVHHKVTVANCITKKVLQTGGEKVSYSHIMEEKGRIPDNFTEITGYNCNYASRILRNGRYSKRTEIKRKRRRKYGEDVKRSLERIWSICDCICEKRLKPFLKEIIPVLEDNDEIHLTGEVKDKLLEMSSATIEGISRCTPLNSIK